METNFTNIKERILYYTDFKGFSKERFFSDLGVTYGNFKGSAKEKALSSDVLAKIVTKYPEINTHWLLTGKGEMLLKEPITAPTVDQVPDAGNAQAVELLEKEVATLKEALKEAYKENGRLELYLEQAKEAIVALKKSDSGIGVPELKNK